MVLGDAVSDIMLRLGQNSDDAKITRKQVKHWISIVKNQMDDERKEEDEEEDEEEKINILTRFTCVCMTKQVLECDDCKEENIITLPVAVKDLKNDRGVYAVQRLGGKPLTRLGSFGMNDLQKKTRFADNTGWYRIGQEIFLEGKFPPSSKFHLLLIVKTLVDAEDDVEIDVSGDREEEWLNRVEAIGRKMIRTPNDLLNDGMDEKVG